MISKHVFITLLMGMLATRPISADTDHHADADDRRGDIVCGPRCIQYVLERMVASPVPSLVEIVSNVQPEFKRGSSLAAMKSYLETKGLHVTPVKPASGTVIRWPHPVILHLDVEEDDLGHYVVLLPESDRTTATVWSGLARTTRIPTWDLASRIGGGALLISPGAVERTEYSFPLTTDNALRRWGWVSILVSSLFIGIIRIVVSRLPTTVRLRPGSSPANIAGGA